MQTAKYIYQGGRQSENPCPRCTGGELALKIVEIPVLSDEPEIIRQCDRCGWSPRDIRAIHHIPFNYRSHQVDIAAFGKLFFQVFIDGIALEGIASKSPGDLIEKAIQLIDTEQWRTETDDDIPF